MESKINKIYKSINGYGSSTNNVPSDVNETYGELTLQGFKKLFDKQSWKGYNFYDLGSGVGKLVIYSHILKDFDKSIGIEFNKERHKKAKTAKKNLLKNNRKTRKNTRGKLIFIEGTIFNKKYFDNKKNSVYFINNLCFNEDMNKQLSEYFNKYRLNSGLKTVIFCSKQIPGLEPYLKGERKVKMSWSNKSTVYKYMM